MSNKTWSVLFEGTQIDVTSHKRLLPPQRLTTLSIDGLPIHKSDSHLAQNHCYLAAPLSNEQGQSLIEVLMGPAGFFGLGCHIYADGQPIGGDTTKKLHAHFPHQWEQIKRRGIGRFLVVRGLLLAGLPFGIAMTVFQAVGFMPGWSNLLSSFMFHTTFFGLSMGYYVWWSLENAFAGQV